MAFFHYFGTLTSKLGPSLPGWQVEVVLNSDLSTVVPIYSDENSTPIVTVSDVANRAVSDDAGNFDFFVPEGTYGLRYYNADGVFQYSQRAISMYGFGSSFTQTGGGAVARTLQDRLRDFAVSAADYSTVAQAVATGKDVFFPDGVWSLSDITVLTEGQRFFGNGPTSILRQSDVTKNMFNVRAARVEFFDLRFEGEATDASRSTFTFFTDPAYPAPYLSITDCAFTSAAAGKGFDNIVKLDTGADHGRVARCSVERLQGNASGHGYFVLCGGVTDVVVSECSGIGSTGRGRHFHYISAGSSYCKSLGNHVSGFPADGITIYSLPAQPACVGNLVKGNTLVSCASAVTSGAISLTQNVRDNVIEGNTIVSSGGGGIVIDGTNGTGLCKNNHVKDNQVIDSQYVGIDIISLAGGTITGNVVSESSRVLAGTYPNIRIKSYGGAEPAVTDILIAGNSSTGTSYARSPVTIDNTAPLPTGISMKGNYFPTCQLTGIELNGVTCAIDGHIRAQVTWDIPSTADGATATLSGISVPGAAPGDMVQADHPSLASGGWFLSGVVTASNTVKITALNKSGGTVDPASGAMTIRVRKETY